MGRAYAMGWVAYAFLVFSVLLHARCSAFSMLSGCVANTERTGRGWITFHRSACRAPRLLMVRDDGNRDDGNRDDGNRDAINSRMASEFERVAMELEQISASSSALSAAASAKAAAGNAAAGNAAISSSSSALQLEDLEEATEQRCSDLGLSSTSNFSPKEFAALQMLLHNTPDKYMTRASDAHDNMAARHGATISCGGEAYSRDVGHSAVVTGDGRLFIWGSGKNGRLGLDSDDTQTAPAQVGGQLAELRRQGIRVKSVSCGYDHSACITQDGRVVIWGRGSRGQLGLGRWQAAHLLLKHCLIYY